MISYQRLNQFLPVWDISAASTLMLVSIDNGTSLQEGENFMTSRTQIGTQELWIQTIGDNTKEGIFINDYFANKYTFNFQWQTQCSTTTIKTDQLRPHQPTLHGFHTLHSSRARTIWREHLQPIGSLPSSSRPVHSTSPTTHPHRN